MAKPESRETVELHVQVDPVLKGRVERAARSLGLRKWEAWTVAAEQWLRRMEGVGDPSQSP